MDKAVSEFAKEIEYKMDQYNSTNEYETLNDYDVNDALISLKDVVGRLVDQVNNESDYSSVPAEAARVAYVAMAIYYMYV